jgi:hypothetical protein
MADGSRIAPIQTRLLGWHKKYFAWLLDNVASPAAPLEWLKRLPAPAGPAGWAVSLIKWLVVIVWAVGFVWLWFLVLWVLILWETFTPSERRGSAPPAARHG